MGPASHSWLDTGSFDWVASLQFAQDDKAVEIGTRKLHLREARRTRVSARHKKARPGAGLSGDSLLTTIFFSVAKFLCLKTPFLLISTNRFLHTPQVVFLVSVMIVRRVQADFKWMALDGSRHMERLT